MSRAGLNSMILGLYHQITPIRFCFVSLQHFPTNACFPLLTFSYMCSLFTLSFIYIYRHIYIYTITFHTRIFVFSVSFTFLSVNFVLDFLMLSQCSVFLMFSCGIIFVYLLLYHSYVSCNHYFLFCYVSSPDSLE